jgi:hypothetical membrane protein
MTQRLLAASGIVGPPIYAIVVFALGSLWPDYSHLRQSMSELGAVDSPYALMMNTAGLPLLGIMVMAFAIGLRRGLRKSRSARFGTFFVALAGGAIVMTGMFPCDSGCINVTGIRIAHRVFATISGIALVLAPFTLIPAISDDNRWRKYAFFSLIVGVIVVVSSTLYGFRIFEQWKGVTQRLSMGVALLWIEVMAMNLLHLSQAKPSRPAQASSPQLQ